MALSLEDKINNRTIKASVAAFGQLSQPAPTQDRMASALDAVKASDVMKRFTHASRSGMLFSLNKKPH